MLRKLDFKIVHLVLNYKEVVAFNLLFLLGDVCFEGWLVCLFVLARQPEALWQIHQRFFSQLPLTPQLANVNLSGSLWIG